MKISDRKKRQASGSTPAFEAVIETAQDYYPFGSLMPGRNPFTGRCSQFMLPAFDPTNPQNTDNGPDC
jgi:hypothetical protein